MKTEAMAYGRAPRTRRYTKLVAALNKLSGWKKREALTVLADNARANFSAFAFHAKLKDWENAIVCLEDGIEEALKIRKELRP